MPDAIRIFIAPPSEETLRLRLSAAATRRPSRSSARLRVAKAELAASDEFPHVVLNDASTTPPTSSSGSSARQRVTRDLARHTVRSAVLPQRPARADRDEQR